MSSVFNTDTNFGMLVLTGLSVSSLALLYSGTAGFAIAPIILSSIAFIWVVLNFVDKFFELEMFDRFFEQDPMEYYKQAQMLSAFLIAPAFGHALAFAVSSFAFWNSIPFVSAYVSATVAQMIVTSLCFTTSYLIYSFLDVIYDEDAKRDLDSFRTFMTKGCVFGLINSTIYFGLGAMSSYLGNVTFAAYPKFLEFASSVLQVSGLQTFSSVGITFLLLGEDLKAFSEWISTEREKQEITI